MAFSYEDLCQEAALIFGKVDPKPFNIQNWLNEYRRTCNSVEVKGMTRVCDEFEHDYRQVGRASHCYNCQQPKADHAVWSS